MTLHTGPLGEKTKYTETYAPEMLFPISRSFVREKIGIYENNLPFSGVDIWTGFELSWLNPKGKPVIALAEFIIPCDSPNIVESKSFKLYLNSFNQTIFSSFEEANATIQKDLNRAYAAEIGVRLFDATYEMKFQKMEGICLDDLDIEIDTYQVTPEYLKTTSRHVKETLYSNLLKSNCLATGQPDWGAVQITYSGSQIDHEGLLKYIVSFRRHSGFAEHCVEQIYQDISRFCKPDQLTVYARYTRRGGLDINPFRSNFESPPNNAPIIRQ